jgi:hypothetical protein
MPSGLSSRFPTTNYQVHNQRTLCHPDRSVAQWRDLRFPFSPPQISRSTTDAPFVIPTGA